MTSITSLQGTDGVTTANSMTKINTNFANLNSDKIETSYLDTDTSLTADSDTKIATQKAVKAYVDAGGNPNASETARGIVQEATDAQVTAGTATGATGAKLFVTPTKLATRLTTVLAGYQTTLVTKSGLISRDLAAASGSVTTAHGLGKIPKLVRMSAFNATVSEVRLSSGSYDGTNTSCTFSSNSTTSSNATSGGSTSVIINIQDYSNSYAQNASITFDSTNITLTWTKIGFPTGTLQISWDAIA